MDKGERGKGRAPAPRGARDKIVIFSGHGVDNIKHKIRSPSHQPLAASRAQ